ncbi:hypothetical protein DYB34_003017 [Aphanomyces astaci]|uniref:Neurotransmitter-gated ion-channel transmembrane domain-containing protein n=1 Tax=Aphanomyces astaci TaxID=112090 RepID=A0A418CCR9_APHAT|nr:hypothetical protein DYB34_003017 [Aphanomyces astaci]
MAQGRFVNAIQKVMSMFSVQARIGSSVVHNATEAKPHRSLGWKSTVTSYTHMPAAPNHRMVLHVTVPLKLRAQVLKKQLHLVCITAGPGGIWVIEKITPDGREIQCRSAIPTDTGTFEWEAVVDGDNMIVRNVTTATVPVEVALATPLNFESRLTVFSLFDVNTVSQVFRADARLELMLPNISLANVKREHVEAFLSALGIHEGHAVQFLNVVDIIGEVVHSSEYVENALQSDTHMDYRLIYRLRAILTGQFVLHAFPFDQQEMTIPIQLHLPRERAVLAVNYRNPSIFQVTNFQLSNVFHVATGNYVVASALFSDINESTTSEIYPRMNFSILLQRRGGYYITHIVIPVTLITYMGFLSFCLDNEGKTIDTGERLLISLTMVLTAVTYKFVVAGAIPQISYLTMLDHYVSFSFYYVCAISVANAFVMIGHNGESRAFHVRLMVTKTFPNSKEGFQGRMFTEMMKELGIEEAHLGHRKKQPINHKVSILHPTHHAIKKIHHSIAQSVSGPQERQIVG